MVEIVDKNTLVLEESEAQPIPFRKVFAGAIGATLGALISWKALTVAPPGRPIPQPLPGMVPPPENGEPIPEKPFSITDPIVGQALFITAGTLIGAGIGLALDKSRPKPRKLKLVDIDTFES